MDSVLCKGIEGTLLQMVPRSPKKMKLIKGPIGAQQDFFPNLGIP